MSLLRRFWIDDTAFVRKQLIRKVSKEEALKRNSLIFKIEIQSQRQHQQRYIGSDAFSI